MDELTHSAYDLSSGVARYDCTIVNINNFKYLFSSVFSQHTTHTTLSVPNLTNTNNANYQGNCIKIGGLINSKLEFVIVSILFIQARICQEL